MKNMKFKRGRPVRGKQTRQIFTSFTFFMSFTWTALVAVLVLQAPVATQAPPALAAALAELDASLTTEFAKDGIGGVSVGVVSGAALCLVRLCLVRPVMSLPAPR